jgi:4a-hydroxytetrahydrobiopterin dehydratase
MSHTWQTQGDTLVLDRQFADFAQALGYVNAVGALAEARNHHPDILLHGFNRVRLTLTTHDAGGTVTDADHAMAAAVDALDAA